MKKITTAFLFFCFAHMFSQDLKWNPTLEVKDNMGISFVGKTENNTYMYAENNLIVFDKTYSKVSEVEIVLEDKKTLLFSSKINK